MSLCERLERLFSTHAPVHRLLPHADAFTAAEVAEASHLPGRELAKVVVLCDKGGSFLMVALPATTSLDVDAVMLATGREGLRLAVEPEFSRLFPDCAAGAMPPFGELYALPLYVDACLSRSPEIAFQAGNHHEVVVMPWAEYERLARPLVGQLCLHRARRRAAS